MGSPDFARSILQALIGKYNLVGVVSQPDRPAGRGKVLTPPPVKMLALEAGIPVIQPERLRRPEAFASLDAWQPELIVVAAYGQILRQNVLDLPRYGCINVHASLLPRWRGAAPVQAALLHGDPETGVTIMKMDAGVDTGPLLSSRSTPIGEVDDAGHLTARLSSIGAELLLATLPDYLSGKLVLQVQDESNATYAPMIRKENGQLDFSLPAKTLVNRVKAFNPWPGTVLFWENQTLKVLLAKPERTGNLAAGQRGILNGYPAIGTAEGALILETVQPAGKKPMDGKVFVNGARNWVQKIPDAG